MWIYLRAIEIKIHWGVYVVNIDLIDLAGKKALVTGASSGMGRAIAIELAHAGVDCALIGRDQTRLEETAHACSDAGHEAHPVICELERIETIEASVREAIRLLGGLNILVNSGGVHTDGKAHEVDLSEWDRMLDVDFRAVYYLIHHALTEIIKEPGGAVINIGSITVPYSGGGMLMGAKRALSGYSEALFEDVREYGVKVCTINPGFVNTPMVKSDRIVREKMIQPEDVARTVMYVLTMSEATCPTDITLRPQRSPFTTS